MFGIGAGKVEIYIPRTAYTVGEAIEGTLALTVNSPVKARGVFLKLFAEQKFREYHHDSGPHHSSSDGHMTTVTRTVYDFVIQFDGEREYPKTLQPVSYPFRVYVPQEAISLRQSAGTGGPVISIGPIKIGGSGFIGGGTGPIGPPEWFLEGYLDLPMAFDVSKRIRLNI
jgi:hypothetical protein